MNRDVSRDRYRHYPPPGTGEPAKFTMDRSGFIVATRLDGTFLGKSNSVEAHLQFAIWHRLQGTQR